MNNRRSYLDAMNAGRRRRPSTSLEQLSQTLDELESRIGSARRPHGGDASYRDDMQRWNAAREDNHVAQELQALREEVRNQMGTGLRREFSTLKGEIEQALRSSGAAGQAGELGAEFERLSAMIQKLADQSDDRQVNLLRLEMEEVRNSLGKLAREETVKSFDRRWDEFDRRWSDIESKVSAPRDGASDRALAALTARLEQIGDAVNTLPTSTTLRSLEDRLKLLSSTVDQFAHQQDRVGSEALDAIEERLNEISRAIAASAAVARPAAFDPEPFERIEARISLLARQIGEVAEENPSKVLFDQLATLSHRVEDLAHRVDVPEQTVSRLADRIETIAGKLDRGAPAPDLDGVFQGLENRFAALSSMLEQRHEDALSQGQSLFRDLERRLEDVAGRIGTGGGSGDNSAHLLEAMDARFAEFASQFEQKAAAPTDDRAIRNLEARLDTISSRVEASVDPDLIRSLESQIAGLAAHLSQPAAPSEVTDIRPRLDKIEQSIFEGRQDVIEAARRAAEEAVRGFSGSASESVHVAGLAEDLKSLEALTRKSDDRNARTFEAIHDTLLKIVDRLGALETARASVRDTLTQTPSLDLSETMPLPEADHGDAAGAAQARPRTPASAAAEAAAEALRGETEGAGAKRSMLGGLTRALSARKGKQEKAEDVQPATAMPAASQLEYETPTVEIDAPLDPQVANQPLEPGSGAPDLNAIMKRVRDERGQPARGSDTDAAKSDFIAAARRAAQAAAAEAEMMKRSPAAKGKSEGFSLGRLFGARRKTVLMGVGAVLLALAALQGGRMLLEARQEVAQAPVSDSVVAEEPTGSIADTQVSEIMPEADAQPVRVIGDDTPPASARSMLANVPESAAEVTTDWLDTAAPLSSAEPEEAAEEAVAEMEVPAEPDEMTFASIPATAGPVALREAAAAGDPKALYEIGNRYAEGRGVPEDMAAAAEWYEKAADHGLAPAQYRIGNLYEKGVGRERDVARAKTWYQLAAAQGNASAMHNLAVLHAMGADGVTDNETAARWFTQAAEMGVKDSQYNLGILSAKGVGMPQNLEEAYKWFALVAKAGDKDAAEKRDEVAGTLSPEQLEKARAATELWRAKTVDEEANAVEIPESWSESTETTATVDLRQAVRNIQQILNKNGYDAGGEDGLLGQKTQRAIAAFQKDNGMEPTGEVDEPLVRALLEKSS